MSIELLDKILKDQQESYSLFAESDHTVLLEIAELFSKTLTAGNKLIFFGNGGSASDAEHVAGEFVGRFLKERSSLPAITLTSNSAAVTAIANDYGYDQLFARQLSGLAQKGDVAIGISTSGNSPNVLNALKVAKDMGLIRVGFTGEPGGKLPEHVDYLFKSPSSHTPRIQEIHICVWHAICELVDEMM